MKKLNTKGFGVVEGLLIVLIIIVLGGVGYYVFNSQKKQNESQNSSQVVEQKPADSPQINSNSLEITALKIKVNDPDKRGLALHTEKVCAAECATEDSYFIKDNNTGYFDRCDYPAGVNKLTESDIKDITSNPDSYMAKNSKKVGDSYYNVFPGSHVQSPCSALKDGDEKYEEEIRQYILSNIVQI